MNFNLPDWTNWTFGLLWLNVKEDSYWTLYIAIGPFSISFDIPKMGRK